MSRMALIWAFCLITPSWAGAGTAEDFFSRTNAIPLVEITIKTSDQLRLFNDPRVYVPATVIEDGVAYEEVALRLKGNEEGSFRPLHEKPAMTLNFDRFKENQTFHGLDKIYLNNEVEDPSLMAETLSTELFDAAGIIVPRVAYARVSLSGKPRGVYVLKEGFNKRFLRSRFRSPDGNFYEGGLVTDVDEDLKKNSGGGAGDFSDLRGLTAAAQAHGAARRWELLDQWIDRDRFARFMAMEVITGHYDGYCMNRNNYRLYRDPASDRFVFLPTGMDIMFSDPDNDIEPYMDGLVARAIIETEPGRRLFYQAVRDLFGKHFELGKLMNRMDQIDRRIRPEIEAMGIVALRDYDQGVKNLRERVQVRVSTVARCLEAPPPQAPEFDAEGWAQVREWQPRDENEEAELQEQLSPDGILSLHINTTARGAFSWRSVLWLAPGRYRLEGRVRVRNVEGWELSFGHGAGLRAAGSGAPRQNELVGTQDWQRVAHEFEMPPADGLEQVELSCDLVASKGEAWFERESLRLARLGGSSLNESEERNPAR